MEDKDVEGVALLSEAFGYPSTPKEIEARFQGIKDDRDHAIFVALRDETDVVGWIHVFGRYTLGSDPSAEIAGIVVHPGYRRSGYGQALMAEAEKWAVERGFAEVRLRSGTSRPEAHKFYPSLGYDALKTQQMYRKKLTSSAKRP